MPTSWENMLGASDAESPGGFAAYESDFASLLFHALTENVVGDERTHLMHDLDIVIGGDRLSLHFSGSSFV